MKGIENNFNTLICGMVVGAFLGLTVHAFIIDAKPKAIDVYRGKTTLEITYRDTIPVDTVVVFKNK